MRTYSDGMICLADDEGRVDVKEFARWFYNGKV